jgi:hypothetical protein
VIEHFSSLEDDSRPMVFACTHFHGTLPLQLYMFNEQYLEIRKHDLIPNAFESGNVKEFYMEVMNDGDKDTNDVTTYLYRYLFLIK